MKLSLLSSQADSIFSSTVRLLGDDGYATEPEALSHCGVSFTANHTLPTPGSYFYELNGEDINGGPFSFLVPRPVTLESGTQYYSFTDIGPGTIEGTSRDFILLFFLLGGTNPYGPSHFQLAIEGLSGFSYIVQPSEVLLGEGETVNVTVLLSVAVSNLEDGSSHLVNVSASNGCTTLYATKTVVITEPVMKGGGAYVLVQVPCQLKKKKSTSIFTWLMIVVYWACSLWGRGRGSGTLGSCFALELSGSKFEILHMHGKTGS